MKAMVLILLDVGHLVKRFACQDLPYRFIDRYLAALW